LTPYRSCWAHTIQEKKKNKPENTFDLSSGYLSNAGKWITKSDVESVSPSQQHKYLKIYDISGLVMVTSLRKHFVLFLLLDGYRQYLGFAPADTMNHDIILEIDDLSEVVIARRMAGSQNLSII
jgi:hypothetical protein